MVTDDLQTRYNQLLALVMRMSDWLTSPESQRLSREEWNFQFQRHQERLEELRRLGDELRPVALRDRLPTPEEAQEFAELFADPAPAPHSETCAGCGERLTEPPVDEQAIWP